MNMKKVPTIATDAELFVRDSKTGIITSVAGVLGADKYNKRHIADDVRIQEDNVLFEFDINPHTSKESFVNNVVKAMKQSGEILGGMGLEYTDCCSHIYSPEELSSFHKDAFVFGCDPDFNALTGEINPKPTATNAGLRTAGAHVHIGFTDDVEVSMMNQQIAGVLCDYFMGLPSIILDPDTRRRELYGKAGSVRFKPYGIEYRTLSNFWLFNDANNQFIWDQTMKVHDNLANYQEFFAMIDPTSVQDVINRGDKHMAEQFISILKVA